MFGFIGQNTPDQLIGNQPTLAANRFFEKRIGSADVAELGYSATFDGSRAVYVMLGDTIVVSRRLAHVGYF